MLLKLAGQGTIERLELDTAFFLGNYPDTALVEGCDGDPEKAPFRTLLSRRKLMGHTRHLFVSELSDRGPFTHLRLKVFPDGGVSRLRAYGRLTDAARDDAAARFFASASPKEAAAMLEACCASKKLVDTMMRERPFDAGGQALMTRARAIVSSLGEPDLLEAIAGHPRIGATSSNPSRFSQAEQARAAETASPGVLAALAEANRAYEAKHGFVFLVFASGKSAEEVLEAARKRMGNTREAELQIAAGELAEITALRLRKSIGG